MWHGFIYLVVPKGILFALFGKPFVFHNIMLEWLKMMENANKHKKPLSVEHSYEVKRANVRYIQEEVNHRQNDAHLKCPTKLFNELFIEHPLLLQTA